MHVPAPLVLQRSSHLGVFSFSQTNATILLGFLLFSSMKTSQLKVEAFKMFYRILIISINKKKKNGIEVGFFVCCLCIIYNKLDQTGLQISANGGSKVQIREASWFLAVSQRCVLFPGSVGICNRHSSSQP